MENDAPEPRPSSVRPPTGPPTVTTVGFSPEPDDRDGDAIRWIQNRGDSVRDSIIESLAQARQREDDEARLRATLDWVSTERSSLARLASELDFFMGIRSSVVEQLELERMVQRPPREDRLPGSEVNAMVGLHEKALASVDQMIEVLTATIASLPGESEIGTGG